MSMILLAKGDGTVPTPSADPYDISGLTGLEFTVTWPTDPTTTSTDNVTTSAGLATAVSSGGSKVINIAAGTYTTDLNFGSNNDIDIVMDNGATIQANINMDNSSRIRWTGGNWDGQTNLDTFSLDGPTTDVLFNNVNLNGRFLQQGSSVGVSRLALINSTVDGDPRLYPGTPDFPWLCSPSSGRASDIILCNVLSDSQSVGNACNRFQHADRFLALDCYFNPTAGGPAGLRFGEECDFVHVEDSIVLDRIFCSLNSAGNLQQVDHGRFENVTRYTAGSIAAFATFHVDNIDSVGVVNNSQMHSDTGGVGSAPDLGEFTTESGNPNVLSYDGSTHPSSASYGADH